MLHGLTGNWVASQRFTPSGYVSAAFPGRTSSTMTKPGAVARGSSSPHSLGGVTHASTLPRDPMRASAIMEHQKGEDGSSSGVASTVNVLCPARVCHVRAGHVAVRPTIAIIGAGLVRLQSWGGNKPTVVSQTHRFHAMSTAAL